ncbi:tyrosine-type recombinase/integrase [Actinokineospora globicatena]|uniref:tyrosine-type recombinase/integrase n=1 Tax=Actinokineospora globicatena TaxID=103729 RepID=UPI0020A3E27C|nr:site-specific integrase [Actinokineospora globicatena]MCP2304996.1 Site-specific recombinase XerD [Actinokineospora globicatena]GLW80458.1 site-specific integrase [Actinokineospora globicatena]GLW87286.1 site-specific integrase [Actinokineospora globicatena]
MTSKGEGRRAAKRNVNGEGTIYARKDGRYEGKVFVPTPDGNWKRVSVYADTWDACHAQVIKLQDRVVRGLPVATTTTTVADYMTYWLREVAKPAIRETTYVTYEGAIRLHIIPGIGKHKLKALAAPQVRAWLSRIGKICQCCAQEKDVKRASNPRLAARCCAKKPSVCCEDFLSGPSIQHLLRVLRAALQDAVDEELLPRNVARLVKLKTTGGRKVRAFTELEAKLLLAQARLHRLYALWAVALAIGLRRGEALGLHWDDVDLEAGEVTVRFALYRVNGQLKLEDVKTDASYATIPLPKPLVVILRAHRKQQLEERFAAGKDWKDTGLVFTTALGGPIEPRNVNRMFATLCQRAEVRQVRVHDLRHSCATLLFTMGVDAATVRRILRHSSVAVTTSIYIEVIDAVQRDAVETLSGFFNDDETG